MVILPPGAQHRDGLSEDQKGDVWMAGGRSVDRSMHATETSFGSQDGKQATERRGRGGRGRGRGSLASEQRGLISSGDRSPPTLSFPRQSHPMFLRRGAFLALKNSSPLKKKGVLQTRLGLESREGRIWMSMKVVDGSRRVCLSITARRVRGRKAHPSLGLHPLKFLTHFGLTVFEARQT